MQITLNNKSDQSFQKQTLEKKKKKKENKEKEKNNWPLPHPFN